MLDGEDNDITCVLYISYTCGSFLESTDTSMLSSICFTEDPHTITASPCSPLKAEWWYIHPSAAFGSVVP